eukprot:7441581-Pyramimonas_sp.AAC.1
MEFPEDTLCPFTTSEVDPSLGRIHQGLNGVQWGYHEPDLGRRASAIEVIEQHGGYEHGGHRVHGLGVRELLACVIAVL